MIRIADSAGWDRRTSRKLLLVKVYAMREAYSSQHPNPEEPRITIVSLAIITDLVPVAGPHSQPIVLGHSRP
jgi:hypothetical protein